MERYDRHILTRLPGMPGIIGLFIEKGGKRFPLLFLGSWLDGIRGLIKNFMDPFFIRYRELREKIEEKIEMEEIRVTCTVIETSPEDIQDILYYLIQTYRPPNNLQSFAGSGRYKNVYVEELQGKDFDEIRRNNSRSPL